MLLAAQDTIRPDIVVIEAYPFGRRQMRFELTPLIHALAGMDRRPALVTSIRDILQDRLKPGRNEETLDILNRYFDLVLVHGDPSFATLCNTFPLAAAIMPEIVYTGMVTSPPAEPSEDRYDVDAKSWVTLLSVDTKN